MRSKFLSTLIVIPLVLGILAHPAELLAEEAHRGQQAAQVVRTATPRAAATATPTGPTAPSTPQAVPPFAPATAASGTATATGTPLAPVASPTVTPTPTSAPTAAPPSATARGNGQWVTNPHPTEMWSSPETDAVSLGGARPGSYFELTGSATDRRLFVYSPRLQEYAWVDATAVGPSTPPPAGYVAAPPRIAAINLPGRSLAYTARSWPRVAPDTRLREIAHNTQVFVTESVRGDDGGVWYRIGEDEYVHADGIRLPKGPPLMYSGRWIDVDLSEPALMTAYEDDRIVYTALALHGTIADQTPSGLYRIQRRVENETMDSTTVGIPRDSPRGYFLDNVLYTQYFTNDGAAIHYNYWSTHFGYAGTHGCLGVNYDDALWFWQWATVGTPVHIH